MSIKLSELKDNDMIFVGDEDVMSKSDYMEYIDEYKEFSICEAIPYKASINAKKMIESALENEYENNMYDGWFFDVIEDVTEDDIKELQIIVDGILNRSQNISYHEGEDIIIDVK